MRNKGVEVHFVDQKLKETFDKLAEGRGEEQEIYNLVLRAIEKLEIDPFIGERVPKYLIPEYYIKRYGANNLRKYNLSDSWRLIYTIVGTDVLIVSIILEWMNHKEYERRFGY
jgi:hypothetical protein